MALPQGIEAARDAGLIYVTDTEPGISRRKSGKGFAYRFPDGVLVKDRKVLDRIRRLAVPPAYRNVWICPLDNGHLQATGVDARDRKQYRYHERFRAVREEAKFGRMIAFGRALPRIRERVDADLRRPGLPRERVLAAVVYLLEKSLIRVGNDAYAKENKSFGLTTLRDRHVKVEGSEIRFRFLGKSKVKHEIELHDRRLARIVKRVQELPGQQLFQYLDEEGERRSVTSSEVNAYLKEIAEEEFTAKDFRTWAATVLAVTHLATADPWTTKTQGKRVVTGVMKEVAHRLGNTPAICRKCYVHPAVLAAYELGGLDAALLADEAIEGDQVADLVERAEGAVLRLLENAG